MLADTPRAQRGWGLLAMLAVGCSLAWTAGAQEAGPAPPQPKVELIEQGDPWFEVYKLFPGTFAIREPWHWERVISYLMVGEDRALLFDTGTGIGDIRAVVSKLTAGDVVVNSHSHPDHIGGNYQFGIIYGLDDPYTAENARGRSVEDSQRFVPEKAFSRAPPPTFSRETYRIRPYRISRYLKDGEVIELGGRSLEVLLVPGHAPDSLSLLDREQRFVLTGDTFYLGRIFVQDKESLAAFATSAKRLAALAGDVDRILPAHQATLLQAAFLPKLDEAFEAIVQGASEGTEFRPGRREHKFGAFSIVTWE